MEGNRNKWHHVIGGILCLLIVLGGIFIPVPMIQALRVTSLPEDHVSCDSSLLSDKQVVKSMTALEKKVDALNRKWDSYLPKSAYIVVNTTKNQFHLYNNKGDLIREGFCSSGSYTKLVLNDKKSWVFKTPKGRMTILSKMVNPVWAKPDWAFIEEGLPVPKPGDPSRFERGVLGDYALRMADGYLIHGTLYKRFLGMPVTHGCIRMGDEDLEEVYKTLNPGSYVYIY